MPVFGGIYVLLLRPNPLIPALPKRRTAPKGVRVRAAV